jgi:hypothetical protein
MTREALYVLASRARERTTLYVATHDQDIDRDDDDAHVNTARHDPHRYEAREILLNILANESAALSATEAIVTAQDEAASLAVLIPRYVHVSRQSAATRGGSDTGSAAVLPWVPSPPKDAGDRLAAYLNEGAALIDARVEQLADAVIRHRPGWARSLGNPPEDHERYAAWRRQIKIIAAYRDQQRITTNDPRHVLGPYPDPDHPAFVTHRHASQAVRAAQSLAEIGPGHASTADTHPTPVSAVLRQRTKSAGSSASAKPPRVSELRRSQQQALPMPLELHHSPQRQTSHYDIGPQPRT